MINKRCIYSLAIATATLLISGSVVTSCTDNDVITQHSEESLVTIQASLAATRMAYGDENDKKITWSKGDSFRFFNNNSAGTTFTLTSGAGTASATFTGASTSGMNTAFYPATNTNIGYAVGYSTLVLPLYGQRQVGNASTNSLSDFTYMIGEAASSTPSKMTFEHLTAQMRFEVTLPEGYEGEITKLEMLLPPGRNHFVADLCPSDESKNIMTHRQSLALSNVSLGTDRILKAYMMMAPTQLSGEDLTIAVTTTGTNVDYYYAEAHDVTISIEAGHQYKVKYTLEPVGEKYPTSDYQLSEDGKTLESWNSYTSTAQIVDMTKDIHLRKITTLAGHAFANEVSEDKYNKAYFEWIQLPDNLIDIEFNGFVYLTNTNSITHIGVGENASEINGNSSQLSYLGWHVEKSNKHFVDRDCHLLTHSGEMLINMSIPAEKNTTVVIPECVISLDRYSINTASNISRLILPSAIAHIDSYAFGWVKSIDELVVPSTTPSAIEVASSSFSNAMYDNTKLVVPTGSKSAYSSHAIWSKFKAGVNEDNVGSDFLIDIPSSSRAPHLITKQLGYLYTVDKDSYELPLELNKKLNWTAHSNADWITLGKTSGNSQSGTTLHIDGNNTDNWRYAVISVTAGGSTQSIRIQQQPVNHILPVVVHILKDGTTNSEAITTEMGQALIDSLNYRYANMKNYSKDGVVLNTFDTHIRLQLATNDPEGNPTNGIIINHVDNANREPHDFLVFDYPNTAQDKKDHSLVWPQNKYINIFILEFEDSDEDENTYVAGVSNLAYLRPDASKEYLGHFYTLDYGYTHNNVNSMHSVTLNSVLLYDRDGNGPTVTTNLVNTAIHEIGHYFSLHHTFDDGPGDAGDDAVEDTPNYNRERYINFATKFWEYYDEYKILEQTGNTSGAFFPTYNDLYQGYLEIFWRLPKGTASVYSYSSHANDAFKASNIMDYYYLRDEIQGFTAGQIERMRYAIVHSPTMPHEGFSTRSDDEQAAFEPNPDIEIHTSVCPPHCKHHNHRHEAFQ